MRVLPHLRNAVRLVRGGGAERRAIARGYYFRLSRSLTPFLVAAGDDMRFLVSTRDDVVGRGLFANGSFELEPMEAVIAELRSRMPARLQRPLFVDVGANIGTSTVAALARFGFERALAIEPDPGNFELLELNLRLNGLAGRARTRRAALSDRAGHVQLARAAGNSGDHRVLPTGRSPSDADDVVAVKAMTLDAVLEETGTPAAEVGLLWIDAQGHEGHVLAGAGSMLREGVPVVLEFWPQALRQAGGLDRLLETIAHRFTTVVDMGPPYAEERPAPRSSAAQDIGELIDRYRGEEFGDVLLVP